MPNENGPSEVIETGVDEGRRGFVGGGLALFADWATRGAVGGALLQAAGCKKNEAPEQSDQVHYDLEGLSKMEIRKACRARFKVVDRDEDGGIKFAMKDKEGRKRRGFSQKEYYGEERVKTRLDGASYMANPDDVFNAQEGEFVQFNRVLRIDFDRNVRGDVSASPYGSVQMAGRTIQITPQMVSFERVPDSNKLLFVVTISQRRFVCPYLYTAEDFNGSEKGKIPVIYERYVKKSEDKPEEVDPFESKWDALNRHLKNDDPNQKKVRTHAFGKVGNDNTDDQAWLNALMNRDSMVLKRRVNEAIEASQDKLVVLDIGTEDCGYCKLVAPAYEAVAKYYNENDRRVEFEKIELGSMGSMENSVGAKVFDPDIMLEPALKGLEKVGFKRDARGMGFPTFVYLHKGKVVNVVPGAGPFLANSPRGVRPANLEMATSYLASMEAMVKATVGER